MAEIVTARRQLSDEKVAAENASRLFEDAILRRLYRRRLMRLASDIALLDKRLAAMVSANVALAQRYRLLTSMPGVASQGRLSSQVHARQSCG
jgi:transposase